ncbi:DedA family protein [Terribacillus saccharophilus]|uniref:DedA family protein n=1 Tax=Terribacillus saccharophilus TaxID=361277 RepID=UPI002DC26159|nr:DedA family protein [Terribacillus saccharophilus]
METWMNELMAAYGYPAIALLMMIEIIVPPLPSEVTLLFGGFLAATTNLNTIFVILSATLGALIGTSILYWIGTLFDIDKLSNWIDKQPKWMRLNSAHLHKAAAWFEKYDVWAVFICRFIPLVRSLISIPAGMAKMNFGVFLLFSFIGTLIWNSIVVMMGVWVGASWTQMEAYLDYYKYGVLGLIIIAIIGVVVWKLGKRKKELKV